MIYLVEIGLLAITVIEAWWHSVLIKENRRIEHGLWAAAYAGLIIPEYWFIHPVFTFILFALACGLGHLVVFNICLNRFRGLPWNYISPTTTSIIDKLEYRMFGGREWVVEIFCALTFILLQFYL